MGNKYDKLQLFFAINFNQKMKFLFLCDDSLNLEYFFSISLLFIVAILMHLTHFLHGVFKYVRG